MVGENCRCFVNSIISLIVAVAASSCSKFFNLLRSSKNVPVSAVTNMSTTYVCISALSVIDVIVNDVIEAELTSVFEHGGVVFGRQLRHTEGVVPALLRPVSCRSVKSFCTEQQST